MKYKREATTKVESDRTRQTSATRVRPKHKRKNEIDVNIEPPEISS